MGITDTRHPLLLGWPRCSALARKRIAANIASEVLVTFGASFLTRFGEKSELAGQGDAAFGGTAWCNVFDQPSERKHAFLVQAYRESLHAAGFQYVLAFEMVDRRTIRSG